jgi:hypothetical protein
MQVLAWIFNFYAVVEKNRRRVRGRNSETN